MAESSFRLPGSLNVIDGNVSDNFKKWKREFQIYMTATGSDKKDKSVQTAILLHCAGPQTLEIYDQFAFANAEEKDDPAIVLKKLEEYCNPRQNEVLESHRFWSTPWRDPFDAFVTDLRKKASSCNFKEADRMIRDKIVFSATGKMQELLLREDGLDLTKAIKIGRAYEQSKKQVEEIREQPEAAVHRINPSAPAKQEWRRNPKQPMEPTNYSRKSNEYKDCAFCGRNHPPRKEACPAWGKTCANCGRYNHFKIKCKREQINAVRNDKGVTDDDEFWLAYVGRETASKLLATMIVNENEIKFQVDTGAEVNTLNQKYVKKSQVNNKTPTLRMWNKSTVKSLGETTLPVTNPKTGEVQHITFIVVPNGFQSLLGLKTVQDLNLIDIRTDMFIGKVEKDLGDLGEVKLHIDDNAKPTVLPSRKIPLAIKEQVKFEIDTLVQRGILVPENEPTEWVNQMAIVRKSNGKLRICLDPQPLNKVLKRERYRLTTFDDIVPNLNQAKIFTKLDVKEAYWHVRLDDASSKLTTMITPFGRFRWTRLPFGLNVSSEIFVRKLNEALSGLEGTFTIMDDIIVVGCGEDEDAAKADNDQKLAALSKRCAEQNIILNDEKTEVGKEIIFHGHKITEKGILPDERKVEAIRSMPAPTNVTEVRRFCGLIQYMAKFLPDLATTLEPIRQLTHKDAEWKWSKECEASFDKLKQQISDAPVLAYYNPDKELVIQVDSSQSGLGAVLMQDGQPIEFASRSLTSAERKWAQIEKEALSILYGLTRFDQYTYARKVVVQNDHKPLEVILRKPLGQAPKRLQDIIMKLLRYDIDFQFVKGTDLVIADTLSRAYVETEISEPLDRSEVKSVENIGAFDQFPDVRILEIKRATAEDKSMLELKNMIVSGWPGKKDIDIELRKYYPLRDTLSVHDDVILKGEAVVVPTALRKEMLQRLHKAHLGYESMDRRARGTIFWPGMRHEIKQFAQNCVQCEDRKPTPQKETLRQHNDGKGPWDKVGSDIFQIQNRAYLIVVDYFSSYIEVDYLTSVSSQQVIEKMKHHFARFGIPRQLITDGGPQYTSSEFAEFARKWGIKHHITSPQHPASNGKAESAVKIMKNLIIKCVESRTDPMEALLEQRNTPRADTKASPADMLFNRKLRTMLPSKLETVPCCQSRLRRKKAVKRSFDRTSRDQSRLPPGQPVYFQHTKDKLWKKGIVEENESQYRVRSEDNGVYARNRVHIRPTKVPVYIREPSPERHSESSPPEDPRVPTDVPDTPVDEPESVPAQHYNLRPRTSMKSPIYLKDYV